MERKCGEEKEGSVADNVNAALAELSELADHRTADNVDAMLSVCKTKLRFVQRQVRMLGCSVLHDFDVDKQLIVSSANTVLAERQGQGGLERRAKGLFCSCHSR